MDFRTEEEAIEAAKAKLREELGNFENNLDKLPDKISSRITEYSKQYDSIAFELSGAVTREVDTHRQTLCCLRQASSSKLVEPLNELVGLSPETSASMQNLLVAQANVRSTIALIKPFINLPESIRELREMLSNTQNLSDVVNKGLKLAENKAKILEKASGPALEHLKNLFAPLEEFEGELHNMIWSVIENCVEVAQKEPKALIRALRIIRKFEEEPERKMKEAIKRGITKRLSQNLNVDNIQKLADNTSEAVSELGVIRDKVLQCFPEDYLMKDFFLQVYRDAIENTINPYLEKDFKDAPGELVLIFQWISQYSSAISEFSPDALEDYSIQLLLSKVKELLPDFIQYMETVLSNCIINAENTHIHNDDLIRMSEGEQILTDTFPETVFTAINSQLGFIGTRLKGEPLIEAIKVSSNRLLSLQKRQKQELDSKVSSDKDPDFILPWICLTINNSQRSASHTLELMQRSQGYFPDNEFNKERIMKYFEKVQKGFIDICGYGARVAAYCICKNIKSMIIDQLFTSQWNVSDFVLNAVATMDDFELSIKNWLNSELYARRFIKFFLETFIIAYLERIVQVFGKVNKVKFEFEILSLLGGGQPQLPGTKEVLSILNNYFETNVRRDKSHLMGVIDREGIEMPVDSIFESLVLFKNNTGDIESLSANLQGMTKNPRELSIALMCSIRPKTK